MSDTNSLAYNASFAAAMHVRNATSDTSSYLNDPAWREGAYDFCKYVDPNGVVSYCDIMTFETSG